MVTENHLADPPSLKTYSAVFRLPVIISGEITITAPEREIRSKAERIIRTEKSIRELFESGSIYPDYDELEIVDLEEASEALKVATSRAS